MTIIAATRTTMACDSFASNSQMTIQVQSKIMSLNNAFMGISGSPLIRDYAENNCSKNIESYVDIVKFWRKFRKWSTKHDHVDKDGDVQSSALFLTPKGIFECEHTGAVNEHVAGYAAIGSGTYIALGALHATNTKGRNQELRVKAAVQAACDHNPFCGGLIRTFTL
jgi:ATP-dependent protease HslVU (ClpYQ) peptidase subunit